MSVAIKAEKEWRDVGRPLSYNATFSSLFVRLYFIYFFIHQSTSTIKNKNIYRTHFSSMD